MERPFKWLSIGIYDIEVRSAGIYLGPIKESISRLNRPTLSLTHLLSGDGFGEETDDHSEEGTPPPLTHLLSGDGCGEEGTPPPLNSPVVWGWVW